MSDTTQSDELIDDRLAKRNAVLLAFAQAIGGAAASIIIATGSLAGHMMLDENKSLATLPVTAMVLGTALGTLPAGIIMRRFGRRPGFAGAALFGAMGGFLSAYAILIDNFAMFTVTCGMVGFAAAFAHQYRFAAADTASDTFKPKAISWVMAGGVLAGVVGPQTVIATKELVPPVFFVGTYLALGGWSLVSLALVSFVKIPKPASGTSKSGGRPLLTIMAQPRFIVSAACGICSFALMSLVMTATPLAMVGCGHSQTDAALGIQWHVLAMFGPSFFTGNLITRFGKERIVAVGLVLLAGCSIVALAGLELAHFWAALVLLGVGWNFGFIGATAMLTDTYRTEERNLVQSVNDFLVFGFVAAASFSSGALLNVYGWETINVLVFPFVALCLVLLGWLVLAEKKLATTT